MEPQVTHNAALQRYELATEAGTAFAQYRPVDGVLVVTHSEVPRALRGGGIGSQLVRGMLDAIRAEGRKVSPRCGFVANYMAEHPEYHDLLA